MEPFYGNNTKITTDYRFPIISVESPLRFGVHNL